MLEAFNWCLIALQIICEENAGSEVANADWSFVTKWLRVGCDG
jgi:hypothetical protein